VRVDRGRVLIHSGEDELSVTWAGRLPAPPIVGDFVAVDLANARVVEILPARQRLSRRAAGSDTEAQAVAANVDLVALVAPVDRLNLARIERGVSLAWDSGAGALVLLTKCDLADDVEALVAEVKTRAIGVDVLPLAALEGSGQDGLDALRARLDGVTTVLLGPSGAGKSTLLNALLGEDVAAVSEVRAGDHKGRHTTVRRELHRLPTGGLLIDTPGTRELGLLAGDDDRPSGFSDIDALSEGCRFRDCSHESEPGCAVRAAVDAGELQRARLSSYFRQQRELRYLAEKAAETDHETRERGRQFGRLVKSAKKLKGR
jgi:ribosome biogenesis GTPase